MICSVCHRKLTSEKSIERKMGPVCAKKAKESEEPIVVQMIIDEFLEEDDWRVIDCNSRYQSSQWVQ